LQYLKDHRARICSFHIKDVVADNSKDCELGTGSVDFKAFFAAAGDLTGRPVVVEQEGSPEPLESARRNVEYLRELKF
jgi:sugar phosphate isomerase/epimerase